MLHHTVWSNNDEKYDTVWITPNNHTSLLLFQPAPGLWMFLSVGVDVKIVNIKYALLYHSQLIFCSVNIGHIAFYVFNVDHTKKKLSMVWKWCLCVSLCLIFFLISYWYIIIWCHNTGHPQLIVVCWVFPLDWFHHIYHITHICFLCEHSPIWMHNEGVTDFLKRGTIFF